MKSEKRKRKKERKTQAKCKHDKGNSLQPHLHQPHSELPKPLRRPSQRFNYKIEILGPKTLQDKFLEIFLM